MKTLQFYMVTMLFSLLPFSFCNAQSFRSYEIVSKDEIKVDILFEEIKDKNEAEKIISVMKSINGIREIELFYPQTNGGYIWCSQNVSVTEIIEKLRAIGVEVSHKTFISSK